MKITIFLITLSFIVLLGVLGTFLKKRSNKKDNDIYPHF